MENQGSSIMYLLLFLSAFCTNAIGSINYIYTADLFFVDERVAAVGFGSLMNRFAGVFSPMVIAYFHYPTNVFAVLCIIAIIALIILNPKHAL
jgi:MFS family permease